MRVKVLSKAIAVSLAASVWTRDDIRERIARVIGPVAQRSVRSLAQVLETNAEALRYRSRANLAASLRIWRSFNRIQKLVVARRRRLVPIVDAPLFLPSPIFEKALVPKLATTRDLCDWLQLSENELDWFADTRNTNAEASSDRLIQYRARWIPRSSGRYRLLESPKERLKAIQRRILADILNSIPSHFAAHGFKTGRSILTATAGHVGEEVVVALDLTEFFPSTNLGRVYGLFRRIGYPHEVARLLTRLCSTVTPRWILAHHPGDRDQARKVERLYRRPHLPQSAPTSPALVNLVAFRLDRRLSRLADSLDARYTRYADDLIFSGDIQFLRGLETTLPLISQIAVEEGYTINLAKTRVMRRTGRQSVLGLSLNDHLNIRRDVFEALKATLYNCHRFGPGDQNHAGHADFRAHLAGSVAWVEQVNPRKGMRLRAIFEEIRW